MQNPSIFAPSTAQSPENLWRTISALTSTREKKVISGEKLDDKPEELLERLKLPMGADGEITNIRAFTKVELALVISRYLRSCRQDGIGKKKPRGMILTGPDTRPEREKDREMMHLCVLMYLAVLDPAINMQAESIHALPDMIEKFPLLGTELFRRVLQSNNLTLLIEVAKTLPAYIERSPKIAFQIVDHLLSSGFPELHIYVVNQMASLIEALQKPRKSPEKAAGQLPESPHEQKKRIETTVAQLDVRDPNCLQTLQALTERIAQLREAIQAQTASPTPMLPSREPALQNPHELLKPGADAMAFSETRAMERLGEAMREMLGSANKETKLAILNILPAISEPLPEVAVHIVFTLYNDSDPDVAVAALENLDIVVVHDRKKARKILTAINERKFISDENDENKDDFFSRIKFSKRYQQSMRLLLLKDYKYAFTYIFDGQYHDTEHISESLAGCVSVVADHGWNDTSKALKQIISSTSFENRPKTKMLAASSLMTTKNPEILRRLLTATVGNTIFESYLVAYIAMRDDIHFDQRWKKHITTETFAVVAAAGRIAEKCPGVALSLAETSLAQTICWRDGEHEIENKKDELNLTIRFLSSAIVQLCKHDRIRAQHVLQCLTEKCRDMKATNGTDEEFLDFDISNLAPIFEHLPALMEEFSDEVTALYQACLPYLSSKRCIAEPFIASIPKLMETHPNFGCEMVEAAMREAGINQLLEVILKIANAHPDRKPSLEKMLVRADMPKGDFKLIDHIPKLLEEDISMEVIAKILNSYLPAALGGDRETCTKILSILPSILEVDIVYGVDILNQLSTHCKDQVQEFVVSFGNQSRSLAQRVQKNLCPKVPPSELAANVRTKILTDASAARESDVAPLLKRVFAVAEGTGFFVQVLDVLMKSKDPRVRVKVGEQLASTSKGFLDAASGIFHNGIEDANEEVRSAFSSLFPQYIRLMDAASVQTRFASLAKSKLFEHTPYKPAHVIDELMVEAACSI